MIEKSKSVLATVALSIACLSLNSTAAHAQTIIYVDDSAVVGGDGTSWESAFRFLRDAFDVGNAAPLGTAEIRVAQGLYFPDQSEANPGGTGEIFSAWQWMAGVKSVIGGYAGLTGLDADDRNPALFPTILSADLNEDDVRPVFGTFGGFAGYSDNAVNVISWNQSGEQLIDGFTIEGGYRFQTTSVGGGGLKITMGDSASNKPVIRNCKFVGNRSAGGGGGAISLHTQINQVYNGTVIIENCRFIANENSASGGGAIFLLNVGAHIRNCVFSRNESTPGGGGIRVHAGAAGANPTVISNCVFVRNKTYSFEGSALHNSRDNLAPSVAPLIVQNSIIWQNANGSNAGPDQVEAESGASVQTELSWCAIQDISPSAIGPNVTSSDMLFLNTHPNWIDETSDDFHLADDVPGISVVDIGNNNLVPPDLTTDLDGGPRIVDGDADFTSTVDLGPYEFVPGCPSCPGARLWTNPLGGIFGDHGNWDIGSPSSANAAFFTINDTYTVNFDDVNEEALSVHLQSGDVTFDLGEFGSNALETTAVTSPGLIVGEEAGDVAKLTIIDGEVRAGIAHVGSASGAIGTLNVTGSDAQLVATDSLCIGCLGNGTMNITNGGVVTSLTADIGDLPGSTGSVLVSGSGSIWNIPFFLIIRDGTLAVEDQGTVIAGATLFGGLFLFNDASLSGDGIIDGSLANFGTVVPEGLTGSLTISGDYVQVGSIPDLGSESGILEIDIQQDGSSVLNDDLFVLGSVDVGGGLVLDFAPGVSLDGTGPLEVITSGGLVTNQFDVVYIRGLPANKVATIGYNDGPLSGTGGVSVSVVNLANAINYEGGSSSTIDEPPSDAVLADLLSDPSPDLAVAMPGANQVAILENDGAGGFVQTQLVTVGTTPSGIVAGELNGVAGLDLAVSNSGDGTVSILSNNAGTFTETLVVPVGNSPSAVEIGLFDGDAVFDLASSNAGDDTVTILLNEFGDATSFVPSTVQVGAAPSDLRAGEIDAGTTTDLAVTLEDDDAVQILTNDGLGTFAAAILLPTGPKPKKIDPKDLDQDKDLDLITVHQVSGEISVLLNNGDGTFAPSVELTVGIVASSLTSLDMDADGDEDLAVVAQSATLLEPVVRLLRNDLDTVTGQLTLTLLDDELAQGENPVIVLSGDVDVDGQVDVVTVGESTSPLSGTINGIVRAQFNLGVCTGDTNGDNVVDVQDLLDLLGAWGPNPGHPADGNGDDVVDVVDLLALLGNWGACSR